MTKLFKVFNTRVPTVGIPNADPDKSVKIWGNRFEKPVIWAKQDVACWKLDDGMYDCELLLAEMISEEEMSLSGSVAGRQWSDVYQRTPLGKFSGITITDPCMQENFRYEGKADFRKKNFLGKVTLEPRDAISAEVTGDVGKRYPCDWAFTTMQGNPTSVLREPRAALTLDCTGQEGGEITCNPRVRGIGQLKRDEMIAIKNVPENQMSTAVAIAIPPYDTVPLFL